MLDSYQVSKLEVVPEAEYCVDVYEQLYRCPKCGFRNLGFRNFCTACGAPFTEEGTQIILKNLERLIAVKLGGK